MLSLWLRVGWEAGTLFSRHFASLFMGVWSLLWVWTFFCEFGLFSMTSASSAKFASLAKSAEFPSSRKHTGSAATLWGLAVQSVISRWEKTVLCIASFAHSIIITIIIVVVVISFIVFLNCLYLSPWILFFPRLLPIPLWWGVSEQLRDPSCRWARVKPQQTLSIAQWWMHSVKLTF